MYERQCPIIEYLTGIQPLRGHSATPDTAHGCGGLTDGLFHRIRRRDRRCGERTRAGVFVSSTAHKRHRRCSAQAPREEKADQDCPGGASEFGELCAGALQQKLAANECQHDRDRAAYMDAVDVGAEPRPDDDAGNRPRKKRSQQREVDVSQAPVSETRDQC